MPKSVWVEPTEKAPKGGVKLSNGHKDGERQFVTIDGPTELSGPLSVNALIKFGPDSKRRETRGHIRVIDAPKPPEPEVSPEPEAENSLNPQVGE